MIPLQESYSPWTLSTYQLPKLTSVCKFSAETLMKLSIVVLLAALGVGCGYSKPANMPAQPGTAPAISQLTPPSTAAGSSTFTLEVDGNNFAAAAVVNFNGTAMTTTRVSTSKLNASIPASAVMNSGTVPVTVTNPGTPGGQYGGGTLPATSAPVNFNITN